MACFFYYLQTDLRVMINLQRQQIESMNRITSTFAFSPLGNMFILQQNLLQATTLLLAYFPVKAKEDPEKN